MSNTTQFSYDESKPSLLESSMQKANIGFLERWQRRIFRLQGRTIFYFKKEKGEPPCGYIPLIDVEVRDLPSKKGRLYGFSVTIKSPNGIAKRGEYLISADTSDDREKWKKAIVANSSKTIVGCPLLCACSIKLSDKDPSRTLLPYFIPPLFKALNETGYKSRGIWTINVSPETIDRMLLKLNENYLLPTNDIHSAVAGFLSYLRQLPESLIPASGFQTFSSGVTVDTLRSKIGEAPAPTRQLLKVLGQHLSLVLSASSQNGVSLATLCATFSTLLIRPNDAAKRLGGAQIKGIQDKVTQLFISHAKEITEDIHNFRGATRLPVLRKARVSQSFQSTDPDVLEAVRGLLVNIVRTDSTGWCTVFTSNGRIGLVHEEHLKQLSAEEENELRSGPNIDAMMDIVREKVPDLSLLFDSMIDEASQLRDALEVGI